MWIVHLTTKSLWSNLNQNHSRNQFLSVLNGKGGKQENSFAFHHICLQDIRLCVRGTKIQVTIWNNFFWSTKKDCQWLNMGRQTRWMRKLKEVALKCLPCSWQFGNDGLILGHSIAQFCYFTLVLGYNERVTNMLQTGLPFSISKTGSCQKYRRGHLNLVSWVCWLDWFWLGYQSIFKRQEQLQHGSPAQNT